MKKILLAFCVLFFASISLAGIIQYTGIRTNTDAGFPSGPQDGNLAIVKGQTWLYTATGTAWRPQSYNVDWNNLRDFNVGAGITLGGVYRTSWPNNGTGGYIPREPPQLSKGIMEI